MPCGGKAGRNVGGAVDAVGVWGGGWSGDWDASSTKPNRNDHKYFESLFVL
jgi:hypothetical protein